ncbi:hypothetical protein [Pseudomonas sp. G(2018)]|uniref:hypothetical protein n=1 Tax=Pseudomonas sp. G(2018) TaxID=2502242 RepID=UPI001C49C340|nr:hypothetical protein [Pseudomonas sp. G(2018)]
MERLKAKEIATLALGKVSGLVEAADALRGDELRQVARHLVIALRELKAANEHCREVLSDEHP